jgi:Alpha/beta hydrolase of unknown function (DUF900).
LISHLIYTIMKILFKLIVVMSLFAVVSCSPIKGLYNNFSAFKHQGELYPEANKPIRIFLDRWGDVYPDLTIEESLFRDSLSVLECYFRSQDNLAQLYKKYNFSFSEPINDRDYKDKFTFLQDYLCKQLADSIDHASQFKKPVLLIHGYNNTPESASAAFSKLELKINKQYPNQKFLFIELYWDGLKDRNHPLNSIKIWDNSQVSAAYVGMGLRSILNKLQTDTIHVITHSHGAAVITEALFNVKRFPDKYYKEHKDGIELVGFQKTIETPKSNFIVGMVAPAIPGVNVFEHYWDRTGEEQIQKVNQENYIFINGFNKYDIIINKYVGVSKKLGATTLACSMKENRKVKKRLQSSKTLFSVVDFSENTKKQFSHKFNKYIDHPKFPDLLSGVLSD